MKKKIRALNPLLLCSIFITISSYNGQTKNDIPALITNKQQTISSGKTKITLPEGVSPHTIFRCSLKDKAGNLWFGTTGAGIYKYDGKFFTRYAEKEGLSNTIVYSIAQDIKGNIWIATDNGIFQSKGDRFSSLEIPGPKESNQFTTIGTGDNNISNNKRAVYCVACDKKGNTWFGTENQGLWRYDGADLTNFRCSDSTWVEVPIGNAANYKQKGLVQSLLEDRKGNIWVSSLATGLNYYDGSLFKQVNLKYSHAHTFQMIEDKSGNIWMATRVNGVCRFNGNTIESFTEKDGVYDNSAGSLYEAKNGNIWIGSLGKSGTGGAGLKGLIVYDGKVFTPIPSKGIRNNLVWTVIQDNSGNIWAGTKEFGLFRYDGKSFTEFTTQ